MPRVGQARRRDSVEAGIVKALEQYGAHVTRISGKGAPDILVRYRGTLWAIEVKELKGTRTPAQCETDWPIVRSLEDVLQALGISWT